MSSELSTHYDPARVEPKWQAYWEGARCFQGEIDEEREVFSLVMPPPNITGVLHLGHCLNATVQDILCRRARMQGKSVVWVPGTDHASIATEARVWAQLQQEGKDRQSVSRETFLEAAQRWRAQYGGMIEQQLQRMGFSLDWRRKVFTMDADYALCVQKVFIDLWERGWLYKGQRMVHWDPVARTVISDEEVIRHTGEVTLYYLRYDIVPEQGEARDYLAVATRRPETLMGDVALCVHPEDERYAAYVGRKCRIPLTGKIIPIIADTYVDRAFGSGVLKITPAHDANDYLIAQRHKLPFLRILEADGRIGGDATLLRGYDRFEARKAIAAMLAEEGYLVKTMQMQGVEGLSQRTNAVVEPWLSEQWFLRMEPLAHLALSALDKGLQFYPKEKFTNTYKQWLLAPRDWCISRQLWWGQRIPVFYNKEGLSVAALNREEAAEKFKQYHGKEALVEDLVQDKDCLDTWFSSWLWPMEVFKGVSQPENEDMRYFFPTSVLVTGQDIIFFWVARMVMAAMLYEGKPPFAAVYFTGMVRDKEGRKMSKSLGNSPDVLHLIDRYGADAVRFSVMIATPVGNDLLFEESALEQGRNFNNKLWNALKLIRKWEENKTDTTHTTDALSFACDWIEHSFRAARHRSEALYEEYKLSEVLTLWYRFLWDDFCSVFLEWVKPRGGMLMNAEVWEQVRRVFSNALQQLHPFMPFITEEICSLLYPERTQALCVRLFPEQQPFDAAILSRGSRMTMLITQVRQHRARYKISKQNPIFAALLSVEQDIYTPMAALLAQQCGLEFCKEAKGAHQDILIHKDSIRLYAADTQEQGERQQASLAHLRQFLSSIENKLNNPQFMQRAQPEVIAREEQKRRDTLQKITLMEQSLKKSKK